MVNVSIMLRLKAILQDGREATYPAKAHNVDDVHFTRLLIDEAHRIAGIDKERVFVLGFSK